MVRPEAGDGGDAPVRPTGVGVGAGRPLLSVLPDGRPVRENQPLAMPDITGSFQPQAGHELMHRRDVPQQLLEAAGQAVLVLELHVARDDGIEALVTPDRIGVIPRGEPAIDQRRCAFVQEIRDHIREQRELIPPALYVLIARGLFGELVR